MGQPRQSATIIASTAIWGLTLASIASRQASTASSRRRCPLGGPPAGGRRAVVDRVHVYRRDRRHRAGRPARRGRTRPGRPAPGRARRAVVRVARDRCRRSSSLSARPSRGPRRPRPCRSRRRPSASSSSARSLASSSDDSAVRLGLGRRDQRGRGVEAGPDAGQPARYRQHRLPARAGLRVAGQPAGPPDVALRRGRGPARGGRGSMPSRRTSTGRDRLGARRCAA